MRHFVFSAQNLCAPLFAAALLGAWQLKAHAVDLSGNPYIKAAPYQPPPLPPVVSSPTSRQAAGGRNADKAQPFAPPNIEYRPPRFADPGKAARHEQWCRRSHPSYRPADNTYRPFDKSGAMPAQARVPCVSPYK